MRLRRFFQLLEDIRKNDSQIFGPKLMLEYGHSNLKSCHVRERHVIWHFWKSSCNRDVNYHSQRLILEIVSLLPY